MDDAVLDRFHEEWDPNPEHGVFAKVLPITSVSGIWLICEINKWLVSLQWFACGRTLLVRFNKPILRGDTIHLAASMHRGTVRVVAFRDGEESLLDYTLEVVHADR